ncbi:MAG: hypothetical protein IRZ16_02640 [Myxococcaceae bacterium]|nr:hypothetical protein [Myxococcaceae bacterium]
MYFYDHNQPMGLAVWLFDKMTDADWDLHFKHLEDMATWSEKSGVRPAVLLIPKGFDMPPTERRTRLTELTNQPGYDPYVAFVAPNKAIQTVLTLFSWFQKKPKYDTSFVASAADGIAWLEKMRGAKLPMLQVMLNDVYKRAGVQAGPEAGVA